MDIIKALIIGLIQGLTEFLPISSTAHMTIFAKLFGADLLREPQKWTAFMAVVQLGTLLSLLVYFRKEILQLIFSFFKINRGPSPNVLQNKIKVNLVWQILLGSLPIFFFGYILKDLIESDLTKSTLLISTTLIFIGLIMFLADKISKREKDINQINYFDAIAIGFAQAMALVPGVSRSGATISAGLFIGFKRESSAYFSFLLSIPAVALSGIYELINHFSYFSFDLLLPTTIAIVSAYVSGISSIKFLLNYLKQHTTLIFVLYRIFIGLAILIFLK